MDARTQAAATDELRSRMRLRLAMNNSRVHRPPVKTGAPGTHPTLPQRDQDPRSDVGTMVWNSVLEPMTHGSQAGLGAQPSLAELLSGVSSPVVVPEPVKSLPAEQSAIPVAQPAVQPVASQAAAAQFAAAQSSGPESIGERMAAPLAGSVATGSAVATGAVPSVTSAAPADPAERLDGMIVPLLPVLSQPSRAAAAVRPAPLVHDQTGYVTQRKGTTTRQHQKRKHHPFRAFFAFLLVAGLLGGAAYAGWYYFLRNQVTWASDVEPLAKFVEDSLHREFTGNVEVETLSTVEYEAKLGLAVIDQSYADLDGSLTALRAVGIAGPAATPSEVGHIVASVRTSFYAPAEATVYRLAGSSPLHEFAMVRSLSSALIDQQIAWSKDFALLTDSQQVGLLATVNSVADAVANARASDGSAEEDSAVEFASRLQVVGYDGDQIPVYVRMAMWPGFTGITRHPVPPVADPLEGLAVPSSDGVVFDLTRDASTAQLPVSAPVSTTSSTAAPRTLGMQFWYEAMLPALGAGAARDAALLWAGDKSAVTTVNNLACINANIATANESDQAAMSAALLQWAQTRPASSAALASTQPGNITSVSMCEPTEGGSDALGGPDALLLVSSASSEGEVGQALLSIGLPDTRAAWNCVVVAHRGGTLADYDAGTVDPAVISLMNDIVRFCSV